MSRQYKSPGNVITKETETVYFNVVIPYNPDQNGNSPAIYQAQLSQPILYNPQTYFAAVVRFQVSGINIPIFIARIQPFPNTNLDNTIYSVAIGYNGAFSPETFVQYVPSDYTAPVSNALTASHPNVDYTPYYYVFEYTDFLEMVNTALATAFAATPGIPGGAIAPYFIYDPIAMRISLIAQQAFYDLDPGGPAIPITIYMNSALFHFFDGLAVNDLVNTGTGRDIQLIVENLSDTNWYWPPGPAMPAGVATLLKMTQQYPALADWNSIQSVQVVSNLLPINREYLPSFDPTRNGIVSSVGILSDFIPLVEVGPEFRTTIEFVANGPWRFIDMFGDSPITRVDLSFYWTDELGVQHIIMVPVGKAATAKLMFIKKDVVAGLEK